MGFFNPLSTILLENKLVGENYIDWKRNLDIVLVAERHKFVLPEPCPDKPNDDTSEEDKAYYAKWIRSNEIARSYILASMSNVLQHQHQNIESASDIMQNLKKLFSHQIRYARQQAMQKLMTQKMTDGSPVRGHVLKMMGYLNKLETLGGKIDEESQVVIILQSLPKRFEQFKLNYYLNNKCYSLFELLRALQLTENILENYRQTLLTNGLTSLPKCGKKKKKAKGQKQAVNKNNGPPPAEGGVKKKTNRGKCFKCNQKGHWKSECPQPNKSGNTVRGVLANLEVK